MSRRPGNTGRGAAALAVSAESAVPLPQLEIARTAGTRRVSRALAFSVFMALFGALWEAGPAFLSWLLSRPLGLQLFGHQTVNHLLFGGGVHGGQLAFGLRTALTMLLLGVAGFVCSYRASASTRPLAALDNGAC